MRSKSYLFAIWFLALCASVGVAANVRWTGNAQDVKQVSTIGATGHWTTGNAATLTINKKSVTVTFGENVGTPEVAAALAAAVDAGSATDDLVGDETRNFGGGEIPEFIEIDAAANGSTLTLTSAVAGVPFTITRSDTAATAADEVQTVTAGGTATGGTFALTYAGQTTAAIAYNANAATVDAALEALSNIGAGDVTCTGGALPGAAVIVTFTGALALTDVAEMTADGALLTGTSPTIAVSTTIHGGPAGALGAVTAVTAATGKNWLSNPDNYDGGALPVDNDTLYIDNGSVSILYALDHFRTAIDLNLVISTDWTGSLGLPLRNAAGYAEYRDRYFEPKADGKTVDFTEGTTGVSGQGPCWIDFQDQTPGAITSRAIRGSGTAPTVFIAGCHDTTGLGQLIIERGLIAIEPDDAPTAITKYARPAAIYLGRPGGELTDARLIIGRNAVMTDTAPVNQYSGTLICNAATTDGATGDKPVRIHGGEAHMLTGPHFEFDVYTGGVLYPDGGSIIDAVRLWGGKIDYRRSVLGASVSKLVMYAGSAAYDHPTVGSIETIDLVGCRLSEVTLELPPNRLMDISADATP